MATHRETQRRFSAAIGFAFVNAPARGSVADSFWQGIVVSVGAMYSEHAIGAGQAVNEGDTVASQERHRSQRFGEASGPRGYMRILPLTRETGGGRRALYRHRGPFGGLHRENLGAQQHAIDDIICAVLREDHPDTGPLLLDRLREWLP